MVKTCFEKLKYRYLRKRYGDPRAYLNRSAQSAFFLKPECSYLDFAREQYESKRDLMIDWSTERWDEWCCLRKKQAQFRKRNKDTVPTREQLEVDYQISSGALDYIAKQSYEKLHRLLEKAVTPERRPEICAAFAEYQENVDRCEAVKPLRAHMIYFGSSGKDGTRILSAPKDTPNS